MIDAKKLRELASKATPGPWRTEQANSYKRWLVIGSMSSHVMYPHDAAFIAAANPAAVLALLDRLEAAERVCEAVDGLVDDDRPLREWRRVRDGQQ